MKQNCNETFAILTTTTSANLLQDVFLDRLQETIMDTRSGLFVLLKEDRDNDSSHVQVEYQQHNPDQRNIDGEVVNPRVDPISLNSNPIRSNNADNINNTGNIDNIDNTDNTDDSETDSVAQTSEDSEEYRSSSEDISEDETEHLGRGNQAHWDRDDETVRLRTTGRIDFPRIRNPSDADTEEALRTVLLSYDRGIRQLRDELQDQTLLLERRQRDLEQAQANAREQSDVATERANTIAALEMANTNLTETINRLEGREERQNSAINDLNIRLNEALEEKRGFANLQVSLGTANGIQNELTVLRENVSRALGENSQILRKLNNQDARFEELKQLFDEIKSTSIAPVLFSAPSQDRWWISSGAIVCLIIIIIIIQLCWNFSLHLI